MAAISASSVCPRNYAAGVCTFHFRRGGLGFSKPGIYSEAKGRRALADAAAFLDQAKSELKELAHARGLKVDSSATSALESILGAALAKAEQTEGQQGFTRQRHIEFDRTAVCLAVEATRAARQGHARVVGGGHIDSATDILRAWRFWPFTGD